MLHSPNKLSFILGVFSPKGRILEITEVFRRKWAWSSRRSWAPLRIRHRIQTSYLKKQILSSFMWQWSFSNSEIVMFKNARSMQWEETNMEKDIYRYTGPMLINAVVSLLKSWNAYWSLVLNFLGGINWQVFYARTYPSKYRHRIFHSVYLKEEETGLEQSLPKTWVTASRKLMVIHNSVIPLWSEYKSHHQHTHSPSPGTGAVVSVFRPGPGTGSAETPSLLPSSALCPSVGSVRCPGPWWLLPGSSGWPADCLSDLWQHRADRRERNASSRAVSSAYCHSLRFLVDTTNTYAK